jgi:hypothetical protein
MDTSSLSGGQVTIFFLLPDFVRCVAVGRVLVEVGGGGVDTTGDSFRALAIDLRASWNGSIEDGWDIFGSGSFFVGGRVGAFLKLGSFGFGFGAEKNDESDFASFTEVTNGLISFFTTGLVVVVDDDATAGFFEGGAVFGGGSLGFRFFPFGSNRMQSINR